jgi:hypothetical protein
LDFSFVTKFQNHGNKHDHGLLWVVNALTHGLDSNKIIENFVDKYITCENDKLPPNFHEVQRHHHQKTSKKKKKTICFNFPWPLMEETQILEPIPLVNPLWRKPI